MPWTQIQGTLYSPREFRRNGRWQLFYDRAARCWTICDADGGPLRHPSGRPLRRLDTRNYELGADDVYLAQEWADCVLDEPRSGLRVGHASRMI
jgi:hypothetical protein